MRALLRLYARPEVVLFLSSLLFLGDSNLRKFYFDKFALLERFLGGSNPFFAIHFFFGTEFISSRYRVSGNGMYVENVKGGKEGTKR